MDVPQTPHVGTAVGQELGLGPLGAQAGWFVAAGLGSSSKAVGILVLFSTAGDGGPLPTIHIMTQHIPKKWETWFNTLLFISLPPGEWLHPECNEPSQPLACAGPFLPTSHVRGKGVHWSRTLSWDLEAHFIATMLLLLCYKAQNSPWDGNVNIGKLVNSC